mmetsp:Transcript_30069/g.71546  ORF Transcript_30069/g.71546 Transcript_30069/m.71546 type:complete len:246 (-) Transcript_30069:604-1341(-)
MWEAAMSLLTSKSSRWRSTAGRSSRASKLGKRFPLAHEAQESSSQTTQPYGREDSKLVSQRGTNADSRSPGAALRSSGKTNMAASRDLLSRLDQQRVRSKANFSQTHFSARPSASKARARDRTCSSTKGAVAASASAASSNGNNAEEGSASAKCPWRASAWLAVMACADEAIRSSPNTRRTLRAAGLKSNSSSFFELAKCWPSISTATCPTVSNTESSLIPSADHALCPPFKPTWCSSTSCSNGC